ncbi:MULTISPECIES: hypothetical protein [Sphingobium]|uniref:hypothetical protein n=1 Tax=Sphingobium TaxID=165695 RepID=UPI00159C75BB|nr:hypothetical protein [Sphingobium sp. 15-1]
MLADERFELVDPNNFREMKLVAGAPLPNSTVEDQLGRVEGDHVWVRESWFLAQPCADATEWLNLFQGMKDYASGKGWVDSMGAIRVHVENNRDEPVTR